VPWASRPPWRCWGARRGGAASLWRGPPQRWSPPPSRSPRPGGPTGVRPARYAVGRGPAPPHCGAPMWQPTRENIVLSPKPIHFGHETILPPYWY
jgi:hypothetical protein